MKSIRKRLMFHFSGQFLLGLVFAVIFFTLLVLFLIVYVSREQLYADFPESLLHLISLETSIEDGGPKISSSYVHQLEQHHMWVQIIRMDGEVIYEQGEAQEIPKQYTISQLVDIQETGQIAGYEVSWHVEFDQQKDSYIMLLGRKNELPQLVEEWSNQYAENGMIPEAKSDVFNQKVREADAELYIVDANNEVVQAFGAEKAKLQHHPLDILLKQYRQGEQNRNIATHHPLGSSLRWVVFQKQNNIIHTEINWVKKTIYIGIIINSLILIMMILYSIWYANRYSRPLLLFVSWLERLGKPHFSYLIADGEQEKLYTKKGVLRQKYQIYEEVIASFQELGHSLKENEEMRQQLERMREEWMSGISHDLRTPIATMKGYGHLMENKEYSFTEQEICKMGSTIREKSEYMQRLVEDFSLIFQLRNTDLPLTLTSVELKSLLRSIVIRFVNDRTLQHVKFEFNEAPERIFLLVDQTLFTRLINNVIMNAIKHNHHKVKIAVTIELAGGCVHIRIEDNGKGMDEETLAQLFTRYYRGTNTIESTEGSGLGMSIAKAVVDAHKGKITVHSKVGKGTSVVISMQLSHEKDK